MVIILYANLYKKKELPVDNEGCVMNLRYIGYVHFLKENRIQNYVGKGEIAFMSMSNFFFPNMSAEFLLLVYSFPRKN